MTFLTTIFNHYGWGIFFWSAFTRFDWNVIIYISSRLYSRSRSCQKCLIFGSFDSIVHCLRINRHQCTNHHLQSSCSPTFPQVHHPHFPTQKVDLKTFFWKEALFSWLPICFIMQILWPKCDSNPLSRAPNYQTEDARWLLHFTGWPSKSEINYPAIFPGSPRP